MYLSPGLSFTMDTSVPGKDSTILPMRVPLGFGWEMNPSCSKPCVQTQKPLQERAALVQVQALCYPYPLAPMWAVDGVPPPAVAR